MTLPSIEQMVRDASQAVRRFPLVLLAAVAATVSGIILIDTEGAQQPLWLNNLIFACLPAAVLLFAVTVTAGKTGMRRSTALLLQGVVVLAAAVYGATLPGNIPEAPGLHGARLALVTIASALLATVLPWLRHGEVNGFWQFNRRLLLRGVLAGLYTGVLFAGLAIALAALENLFGIDIPEKRYPELWIALVGIFAVWFFLAGVPADLSTLDADTSYPKGAKVFAQYIVLPLALLYLVILYAYLARIVIVWEWPRGWVTGLVLGFAATGTFTMLLLHPVRELAGNTWIRRAAHWYHIALIPPVILLFLALWRRVSEYGMTESRYLAVLLGVWCGIMIVYFLASRKRSIMAIPLSLAVLGVLASAGPWSAFSISESSQLARLETLLARNALLSDGRAAKATQPVPDRDVREISSALTYLRSMHGFDGVQPWFATPLVRDDGSGAFVDAREVTEQLGIEYVSGWAGEDQEYVTFTTDDAAAVSVAGYDIMLPERVFSKEEALHRFPGAEMTLRTNDDRSTLTVTVLRDDVAVDSLRIDMRALAQRVNASYAMKNPRAVPPGSMSVSASGARADVRVVCTMLTLHREDGRLDITRFRAGVLARFRTDQSSER